MFFVSAANRALARYPKPVRPRLPDPCGPTGPRQAVLGPEARGTSWLGVKKFRHDFPKIINGCRRFAQAKCHQATVSFPPMNAPSGGNLFFFCPATVGPRRPIRAMSRRVWPPGLGTVRSGAAILIAIHFPPRHWQLVPATNYGLSWRVNEVWRPSVMRGVWLMGVSGYPVLGRLLALAHLGWA